MLFRNGVFFDGKIIAPRQIRFKERKTTTSLEHPPVAMAAPAFVGSILGAIINSACCNGAGSCRRHWAN